VRFNKNYLFKVKIKKKDAGSTVMKKFLLLGALLLGVASSTAPLYCRPICVNGLDENASPGLGGLCPNGYHENN
jgi:hypothetical protein